MTIVKKRSQKTPKTVSKGVLKAKMLAYFRGVEKTGEELIVLDHNVPVLKIVPIKRQASADEVFHDLRIRRPLRGDVTGPVGQDWEKELT